MKDHLGRPISPTLNDHDASTEPFWNSRDELEDGTRRQTLFFGTEADAKRVLKNVHIPKSIMAKFGKKDR